LHAPGNKFTFYGSDITQLTDIPFTSINKSGNT